MIPFRSRRRRVLQTLAAIVVSHVATAQPRVWNVGAPGVTLARVEADSGEGDEIRLLLAGSPYRGGIRLRNGQSLVGEAGVVLEAGDGSAITIMDAGKVRVAHLVVKSSAPAPAIRIEGGSGDVSFEGVTVTQSGGAALEVRGRTGGAVRFDARSVVTVAGGPADGVVFAGNRGSIDFGALLSIVTTGARGVLIQSSERVTISGAGSTIRGATGRAISVIGSSGTTLRGITLTDNALNGVPAVLCGSDLQGGNNRDCNAALYLRQASDTVLEDVQISGSGQMGISGHEVSNLRMTRVGVEFAGNEVHEHAIVLQNATGDIRLASCTVEKNASRGLYLHNGTGSASVTVEDCTFRDIPEGTGQQAILIASTGSAQIHARIVGSAFERMPATAIHVAPEEQSRLTLDVLGNTFNAVKGGAALVATSGDAAVRLQIARNVVTRAGTSVFSIYQSTASKGTVSGELSGNVIGRLGEAGSGAVCGGCSGVSIAANGAGRIEVAVRANTIRQVDGSGVRVVGAGSSHVEVAVTGNRLYEPAGNGTASAIHVQAGTSPEDKAAVCAVIGGAGDQANELRGSWRADGNLSVQNRFPRTILRLAGYGGAPADLAAVRSFLASRNAGAVVLPRLLTEPGRENGFAGGTCTSTGVR